MMQPRSLLMMSFVVLSFVGCTAHRQYRDGTLGAATPAFPELVAVHGEQSPHAVRLVVSNDIFVADTELTAGAQRDLTAIAAYLQHHPDRKLVIAPARGAPGTDLTRRREATVEAFFLKRGVDPDRVAATSTALTAR